MPNGTYYYNPQLILLQQANLDRICNLYNLQTQHDRRVAQFFLFDGMKNSEGERVISLREFQRLSGNKSATFDDIYNLPYTRYAICGEWGGEATSVGVDVPTEVEDIIITEGKSRYEKIGKIEMISRKEWTAHRERMKKKEEEQELLTMYDFPTHPAREMIKYLHSARIRKLFTSTIKENSKNVDAVIDKLPKEEQVEHYKDLLALVTSINAYSPKDKTDRIYAPTCYLPKEIREAMFAGCISIDLKSCQFRIISKLWNLPQLNEIDNIWQHFYNELGVGAEDKADIKQMLYTIIYGGGERIMRKTISNQELIDPFLDLDVIRMILSARETAIERIKEHKYIFDAWKSKKYLYDVEGKNIDIKARSLLGRQGQSYEMRLMLAAFDFVKSDSDLSLINLVHDGGYVKCTNHHNNLEHKLTKLKEHVNKVGCYLDMKIELETEYLG